MKLYRAVVLILFILMFLPDILPAQSISYDTLTVSRNWRTRKEIILRELRLPAAGTVDESQIKRGIDRIWDIGNFANVKFELDTLKDGRARLNIMARDAFNIVPIISFSGNFNDYSASLGLNDHNFLGKNIELYGKYQFGTYRHSGAFRIGIPRQLLYKNMSIDTGMSFGEARRYRYENDSIVSGVGYRDMQFSLGLGNPFHTDDYYTFSPNIRVTVFRHQLDHSYLDIEGMPYYEPGSLLYTSFTIGESVGKIYRRKHRLDGFSSGISYTYGLGLNEVSKNYHQFGFSVQFHKRFDRIIQLSSSFTNSYTTADAPSLLYYHGGSTIKGLRTGMISGKTVYTSYLGVHLTYIDMQWLAIEHKIYVNSGQGADSLKDLYTIPPFFSVGTGVRFMVPMIPWLYINFYFSYSGKNRDWFFLEF